MEVRTHNVMVLVLLLEAIVNIAGGIKLKIQPFHFPSDSSNGKRVSVTCTPLTGEKMEFKWLHNGQEIVSRRQNINIASLPMFSNLIIDPLTTEDSGNYTCIVSARGLTGSFTTMLDVLSPPSWSSFPLDTDASSGDLLVLNCKGIGKPQPVVTWYKIQGDSTDSLLTTESNSVILSNGSLLFESVSKEDEGMYKCNISNGIGNALTKEVMVKVIVWIITVLFIMGTIVVDSLHIPPFSFPSESAIIGKRVSATCTPSSGEKMEFKWFRNGKELTKGLNIDIRSFPDLSTLVIDSLTSEDSGNYTCTVNSRGVTASFTTNLQVLVPPTWEFIPKDFDALSGDPVVLNCAGSGTPKPTSTWYKSQGEATDFLPVTNMQLPTVFSNGSLFLSSIQKEDEGMYKCNVSNGIGTPLLRTIIVRVIDGSSLNIQPFSFPSNSAIGKRVSVTCTPLEGEKMDFKWFRDGKELTKGWQNVNILLYPMVSVLVIDPLTTDDSVPPSWEISPTDAEANNGDSLLLKCKGTGRPEPTTVWSKTRNDNSDLISLSGSNQATVFSNGTLYIVSITKADEGMYKCNVSNGIGSSLIKTVLVKVIAMEAPLLWILLFCLWSFTKGNPILKIQPFFFPEESVIGKRVSATCTPSTGEKMEFKWLKNGKEITRNKQNVNVLSYPVISSIVIDPLTVEDSGNYTCVVSARGLSGSYTTFLNVLAPPVFKTIPKDYDALSGETVVINCQGSGRPEPVASWSRNTGNGAFKIQPFTFPTKSVIGQRITTTCSTFSNEKMTFKWLKDGREITTTNNIQIRSFPEFSTLILDSLSVDDAVPPAWITLPRDIESKIDDIINVDCKGIGNPIPSVYWSRTLSHNIEALPITNTSQTIVYLNGTLTLNNIKKDDEGIYKCNISNGIGSDLLKTVVIKVIGIKAFKIQPFSFPTSIIGKRITTTCATTTSGKMSFKWMKNGREILKNNKINFMTFPELSNLIIDPLSEDDSGNYTCIANAHGISESYTTVLEVLAPPSWKVTPSDIDAVSGDSVTLNCQGTGKPEPSVAWSRSIGSSSDYAPLSTSNHHIIHQNGSIVLPNIQKENEGLYKCNISNGIGDPLVKAVIIKVIDVNLKIQSFNFPATPIIGQRVNTMCATVIATDKMEFYWSKNGSDLKKSNRVQILTFPQFSSLIIDPLIEEDSGNYTCTVMSKGTSDTYTAALNVLSIDKEVKTLENTENIHIHLNGSLEIRQINKETEGYYQCIVSNGVGTELKKDVNIKVIDAWKIQPFIFPTGSKIGQRVSTICATTGGKNPNFEWLKDGKDLKEGPTIKFITMSGVSTIIIEPISESDSGNYTCVAKSEGISDAFTATLNVNVPPEWLTIPSDKEALSDDTVIMTCEATGKPKPITTWVKYNDMDGKYYPIVSDSAALQNRIFFLKNGSLKITELNKGDEGIYQCVVSNDIGESLTKSATLRVIENWKIQPFNFPPKLTVGTRATGVCSTTTGKGLQFQWMKNGQKIDKSPNVQIRSYTDSSMILIDPLTEADSGNYTCVVKSDFLTDSFTAPLVVLISPTWIKMPLDSDVLAGEDVSLPCHTVGKPDPIVQWKNSKMGDSVFINILQGDNFQILANGSLIISAVQKTDEGLYKCNVSNGVGNSLEAVMSLRVIGSTKIQKIMFPDQVLSGTKTSATCTAISGSPPMEFKWYKNGKLIQMNSQKSTIRTYTDFSVIFLEDVDQTSTGNYTCEVISGSGSDSYTALLEVKDPPKWTKQPKDTSLNSGMDIELECAATGYPLPNVTWKKALEASQEQYVNLQSQKQVPGRSILEIKHASSEATGFYLCEADNGISKIKTNGIVISVSDLPKVQKIFFPDQVITGQRTSATCTALSGTPPMEFKWLKNGQPIKTNQQFSIRSSTDYSILFIENVDLSTSANYTCELTNPFGSDRYTALLEVKEPPKWIKIPKDAYVSAGDNISLECTASGFPLPDVSWMRNSAYGKDSAEVVSAQKKSNGKSILAKKHVTVEDAGFYFCIADNSIEKIQTNGVIISISGFSVNAESPRIQPFNLASRFRTGEKVTILCAIKSGTPPFQFTWLKNSQSLGKEEAVEIVQFKDFSNLVLPSLIISSKGNYTCQVTNNYGSDSHTESLNVVVPPKWSLLPKDKETVVGDDLSIECVAKGYPTPVVTWKIYDKENIKKYSIDQRSPRIETTNGILKISSATKEDEGNYVCEASNDIGEGITHTVLVSVLGSPRIQPFIFPEKLTEGQKTKVLCSVVDGLGPFKFHWYKNNQHVQSTSHITIQNHDDYSVIFINSLETDHAGNYSCMVTSSLGKDSFSAQLLVNVPPAITREPVDQTIEEGNFAALSCQATGVPPPTITWRKEQEVKDSFESDRVKSFSNGTLIISNLNKNDEGTYVCIIFNNIGQEIRKLVSLNVIVPARFEEKFQVQNVRRGETSTLKCEAVGDKPLSITWTKDKAEIDFKKHTRLEKFDRDVEKGLSSELIIRTSDRKDGALYGCLAKNEYGSDERNVKLLVVEVPAQPMDVKVKEVWSRTASIMWSAPYSGNSPITKYIIQYWRDRGGPHRLLEDTIPHSQTTVLLKNLQPGTPYGVTVLGENEIGQGQPSDILKFVTGEEEPSGPPTDVWVEAKSSSSILVTWKPPPRELWNGDLRGYFVGYKVDGSSHAYSFKTVDSVQNDTHDFVLGNLMKSTRYNIVVKAYNGAGTGPPSQDLVAKTLDGDVPEAPAFTVVAASESKISLRWGDPPSRTIPVTGYTLHYKKDGVEWYHIPIIASSSKNRFTLTGLESSTPYKIYITASNQYGNGEPSDITTVTTSMKGFVIGNTETYVDLAVIVPVAACILAFIVVTIVVIIYYKKSKARNSLERALQGGKPFPYTGSTQRYIDIDKTRLPAEPGTLGSSYATIPSAEMIEESTQEMKAFMHGNMKDRPLPSKPSSMKKKNKGHVYDTAQ
ncbi:hypothetical protein JTE90_001187 [Oedothorax gibbosus]|uniref:Hemicentin-1 n=1 Tax=Oedothorax gibbosus TaxID=931172 RepID=A0AAV6UU13_9ARAC|nr:hypothetical protein JTE90_001187 [Oedothorax gibbosus]